MTGVTPLGSIGSRSDGCKFNASAIPSTLFGLGVPLTVEAGIAEFMFSSSPPSVSGGGMVFGADSRFVPVREDTGGLHLKHFQSEATPLY